MLFVLKISTKYLEDIIEENNRWRKEYNQIRPHSSLGYRPPAPEAIYPKIQQFDKSFVN